MTLAELLASKKQGTGRFPGFSLADLLARRNEPLDAKFNPSGVGPGMSYGSLASILADFTPGIGDVKSAADALRAASAGHYGEAALDAVGALPLVAGIGAIKAYHGSPHAFDAFDMSKIGTGEGAQAYGHGLYFAESPEVAREYQRTLARTTGDAESMARAAVENHGGDRNSAIDFFRENLAAEYAKENPDKSWIEKNSGILDVLLSNRDLSGGSGSLYETSLEWPDPAREAADPLGPQHFLDWDKPLSDQPESIREALAIIDHDSYHASGDDYDAAELGQSIYNRLLNQKRDYNITAGRNALTTLPASQAGAAEDLLSFGIPGIRYLDQGSRGNGAGTYNYVVFDDKIPRIISRNGVTLADLLKR